METDCLLSLIEKIYDCAIDPGAWPGALKKTMVVLDSRAATLNMLDAVTGAERTLVYTGISDAHQALYRECYQGCDLFVHGMLLRPIDEPATSDELVPETELLGSRIYREWAAPQGFRHVMVTTLVRTRARLAFLGVTRRYDQPRYDARDKARMAVLAPHIRRAMTIADLIDHKSLERDDLAATLDAQATAVLIVGDGARLVHANTAGRSLLAGGDLLTERGGTVEPWDRTAAAALRAIVERAGAGTLRLARRDGGHAVVSALPLGSGQRRIGARSRIALFVQPEAAAPNAAEIIGRLYRLTGAELRVLLGLAEGETPASIAARYGIAASTVRSHLKSLFVKTGTNRQVDVIKLLLTAPPVGAGALPPAEGG